MPKFIVKMGPMSSATAPRTWCVAGERAKRGRWPRMGHAPGTVGGSFKPLPLERWKKKRRIGIRERSAIARGVKGESILVSVEDS